MTIEKELNIWAAVIILLVASPFIAEYTVAALEPYFRFMVWLVVAISLLFPWYGERIRKHMKHSNSAVLSKIAEHDEAFEKNTTKYKLIGLFCAANIVFIALMQFIYAVK